MMDKAARNPMLWCDEKGATAVEYAIMVATVAIVIIATVAVIGLKLSAIFQSLIGKF